MWLYLHLCNDGSLRPCLVRSENIAMAADCGDGTGTAIVFAGEDAPCIVAEPFEKIMGWIAGSDIQMSPPRLIPVEERLPDVGSKGVSEEVLCKLRGGGFCFDNLIRNKAGETWFRCEMSGEVEVAAWMPLPVE